MKRHLWSGLLKDSSLTVLVPLYEGDNLQEVPLDPPLEVVGVPVSEFKDKEVVLGVVDTLIPTKRVGNVNRVRNTM